MLLNGLGHLRAEDAVPGLGVARLAKVVHRQGFPVLFIGCVVDVDVAAGADDLILNLQPGPLRHGAWLGLDRHRLTGLGLRGQMLDLGQARQCLGG